MYIKLKLKSVLRGLMVSFLLGGPVKGKASESVGSANEYGTEVIEEMSPKEKYRARAQKILNLGLFKAIEQKSLRGVIFLLEGGADPTKENERGQTPIDFAECRFEEDLEALEYEEIIEVLRDWSPEQYPVDERMIIARARKIWGLKGGGGGASSAGGGGSSGSGGSGRSGGSGMSFSASGGDDHVRPSDLGSSGSRASELISNYQRSTMPGHGIFSRPTDAPTSSRAAEMISNARAPSFMRRDADTIASGGSPGMTNWATTMETGGHHHEMRSAHLSSSSISSSSFGTPIPEVSDPIRRDRETESGAGTETGLLTRIGEIAVQFIPGYDAYQILNNDGSIWEATKSLAKDGVATIAGMKFLKVGGKIITQNGGKVFELVKEGSKVLLKKGEEELGKAFGPRLVPEVVGGATTKLTQTESEATLPQVMLFSKAARPQPLKNSGSGGGGGSGSGKLIPKTEASKSERVIPTKEMQETCWEKLKQSGEWKQVSHRSKPTLENKKTGQFLQKSIEKWELEAFDKREKHIGIMRPNEPGIIRTEFAVRGRKMEK